MESNKPDDIFFSDPDIYESQFAYAALFPDIPFWIELGRRFGPKVLELACGNGRVTIPVFESGLDIDGIDFSEPFLNVARKRAAARSLPITFMHGDIRALPFKEHYDLMFLPSGTISHLVTRPEAESFLAGVHRGLRPDGVLALDVHNPATTFLKSPPPNRGVELSTFQHGVTKETVSVLTKVSYKADIQVFTVSYHYTFADNSTHDAAIVLKLYFPGELQSLLHDNGFEVIHVYADYQQKEWDAGCVKYVVVARKGTRA